MLSQPPPEHAEHPTAAKDHNNDADKKRQNRERNRQQQQPDVNVNVSLSSSSFDIDDLLDEVDHDGLAILLRRPDRISVSYYSPPSYQRDDIIVDCVGVDTDEKKQECNNNEGNQNPSGMFLSGLKFNTSVTGAIVIGTIQKQINDTQCNDTTDNINPCALLEGSHHSPTYFDLGDVVEYTCSVDCFQGKRTANDDATTANSPASTIVDAEASNGDNIRVALNQKNRQLTELHTMMRESNTYDFATTVCVSTIKSLEKPIRLCQAILFADTDRLHSSTAHTKSTNINRESNTNDIDMGIKFTQEDDRLTIASISNDGWFGSAGCAIKKGHVVVGIDNFISSTLSPDDATSLIHAILSSPTSSKLSITTIAPPRINKTKWDQLRKTAVAAGGGTLVASGAVLMATPLHPVGHAMALGGMGVLGMEFEAPRTVMNSVKERWSKRKSWSRKKSSSVSQGKDGTCEEKEANDVCG